MKLLRVLLVFAIATFGVAVSSEAGSVTCPGGGATRSFTLVIPGAPTATCGPSGDGANDVNGDSDDFFTPEWEAFDKDPETASSETATTNTWMTFTLTPGDDTSGSVTISSAVWGAYGEVLLAFKVGGGQTSPSWASFLLPFGWFGTATFNIDPNAGSGLSHITAYGRGEPNLTQVPEPAALLLFGTGLAATAVAIRRRRRTVDVK